MRRQLVVPAVVLLFLLSGAVVSGTEILKPHHLPLGRSRSLRVLSNPSGEVEVHLLPTASPDPVTSSLAGLADFQGPSAAHHAIGHDHVYSYFVPDLDNLPKVMTILRNLEDESPPLLSYALALQDISYTGGGLLAAPRADDEWHLGSISGKESVNAYAAHSTTKGAGAHVTLTDAMFDSEAPQLAGNFDSSKSINFLVPSGDPERNNPRPEMLAGTWGTPDGVLGQSRAHGTQCAGMVAAVEGTCSRGIAPEATWSGVRLPHLQVEEGTQTERHSAMGIAHSQSGVDAWSMSHWISARFNDPLKWVVNYYGTAFPAALQAAQNSVLVISAGNDRKVPCGIWDYMNWPETVMVGASYHTGDPTTYTSEGGGSILLSAPAGDCDTPEWPSITSVHTVDVAGPLGADPGDCSDFCGTSASCPQVAGVVALIQSAAGEAGRKLLNREVQLVLADSASLTIPRTADRLDDFGTSTIRGPDTYSFLLGFGVPDADKAVKLAQTVSRSPIEFLGNIDVTPEITADIPLNAAGSVLGTFTVEAESTHLVQFITGSLTVTHDQALELKIVLTNAEGTECNLWGFSNPAEKFGELDVAGPYQKNFKCHPFLGSRAASTYTVTATDIESYTTPTAGAGRVTDLTLTIHGYRGTIGSPFVWIMTGAAVLGVGTAGAAYQQRRRSKSKKRVVKKHPASAAAAAAAASTESKPVAEEVAALPTMMAPPGAGSTGSRSSVGSKGSRNSRASKSSSGGKRKSKGSKGSRGGKRGKRKARSKSPRPASTTDTEDVVVVS